MVALLSREIINQTCKPSRSFYTYIYIYICLRARTSFEAAGLSATISAHSTVDRGMRQETAMCRLAFLSSLSNR